MGTTRTRIAVIGAGAIGRTHLAAIAACPGVELAGLADLAPEAAALAWRCGCPHFAAFEAALDSRPDGLVIATPNALHVPQALAAIAAGIPVLVEKPLADSLDAAERLAAAAERAGVPGLVGHHRRHNPILRRLKHEIDAGRLGRLVAGTVMATLAKPASYFDVAWRRTPGEGGPMLINLIHEIDLLRYLFGAVAAVSATVSHRSRGLPVEDSAALILTMAQGGLVTVTLSDAAVGPWAWDITAGENPARFPSHAAPSHLFAGTKAGVSLPDLTWWTHPGSPDWTRKMTSAADPVAGEDCYVEQIRHFAAVIAGHEAPLVSLRDGAENIRVAEAARASAASGTAIRLAPARKSDGASPCPV